MAVAPNPVEYTDKEKIKRYKSRVEAAQKEQKTWHDKVENFLKYYRNKEQVYTKGGQRVVVPMAIQAVDAMFAALTSYDVSISITPLGLTTRDQSRVAEQALYNEWLSCKVQEKSDYAVKEALIAGLGWVKVSYDFEDEEVDKDDDELKAEVKSIVQEMRAAGEQPDEEAIAEKVSATKTETIRDRVVVEHIPYDELYWDFEAKKPEDIRWVCQRIELPLEQILEDDSFVNKQDLKEDTAVDEKLRDSPKDNPTDDEKRVVLWQFWDFETGTVCWFSKSHDKILKEGANPFAFHNDLEDRNPYVPLVLRFDPGKVPGISDIEVMKPSIDEANILRSNLATYVDRFKTKLLAKEGSFTDAGKQAFRSQEHGAVVELTPNAVPGDVRPLDMPTLPQEAFAQDQKALTDGRDAIGLNEVLQGLLPVGKKTATAMNILSDASQTRQAEKRNRMERFYRNIAYRMLVLMQMFYEEPRITRMVEDYGEVAWDWSADDINMQAFVEITVEPKKVTDNASKAERAMMLKNIFGIDPTVDPIELNKYLLEDLGVPAEVVQKLLKLPEQQQTEALAAAQQTAVNKNAEQGVMPDPADIPGPLPGDEAALLANPGEEPGGFPGR